MTRYLPTLRGWLALLLPVVAGFVLLATFPARFIESGVGTWIQEPVAPLAWVLSGVFIVSCVGACLEAFRRGSRIDRTVLILAVLLTFSLIYQFFAFMILKVRPTPI